MYWKSKKNGKIIYCSEVISLDIETAWNHDEENTKTWLVSAQVYFDYKYYLFRTPSELMAWYKGLIDKYNLNDTKRIITIIHNASFDLSYLLPYIQREFSEYESNGIYDAPHKIICYRQGCFEWRCTYRLTSASLAKWSKEMNVKHPKQIGLYDYNKIIYQDSELTTDEEIYDKYDILALDEAFTKQLQYNNDDVTSVPYTSTGYIRRILRKSAHDDNYYRDRYFINSKLDVTSYRMCLNSYAGGYTHQNRFYADELVVIPDGKVGKHRDFRSHYPTQLRTYMLPFGKPIMYYDITNPINRTFGCTVDEILRQSPTYYTISQIKIYNMRLRDQKCSMPFMQVSKMYERDNVNMLHDNGRLLSMNRGSFITYVDNYTLEILNEQYKFEYVVIRVVKFKNMPLPDCLADVIDDLFKKKSDYKIEHKRCEKEYGEFDNRTYDANFNLMQSKKLLNGIYGCFAMNPVRTNYDIDTTRSDGFFKVSDNPQTDEELQLALDKYYSGKNNFLPYQVGVACTSLARYELFQYIKAVGYDNVLYCDTDSIFYIGDEETETRVNALNKEKAKNAPYVTDMNGKKIQYDVFEEEADFIAFKGLHAKCYGIVTRRDEGDELKITVAGVPEKTLIDMQDGKPVYMTREQELAGLSKRKVLKGQTKFNALKTLDKLTEGFTFHVNAGMTCKYIEETPHIETINGHKIETAGGAVIIPLKSKEIHNIDLVLGFDFTYEYRPLEGVVDIN